MKYRKKAIDEQIGVSLKEICLGLSERFDVQFVEIGFEEDHVHEFI